MILGLFKKKKCEHEWEVIGHFYKEHFTEYTNRFDSVCVYEKFRCKKCGAFSDYLLSSESFLPQLHSGREKRRDDYILKLKNMGFKQEIEIMISKERSV